MQTLFYSIGREGKNSIDNVNKTGIILLQSKELEIIESMSTPLSAIEENIAESYIRLRSMKN